MNRLFILTEVLQIWLQRLVGFLRRKPFRLFRRGPILHTRWGLSPSWLEVDYCEHCYDCRPDTNTRDIP